MRRATRQRPGHQDPIPAMQNRWRLRQRHWHHDQVPATHNERRRGQQPGPVLGITVVPIHNKCPAFAFYYSVLSSQTFRITLPRSGV